MPDFVARSEVSTLHITANRSAPDDTPVTVGPAVQRFKTSTSISTFLCRGLGRQLSIKRRPPLTRKRPSKNSTLTTRTTDAAREAAPSATAKRYSSSSRRGLRLTQANLGRLALVMAAGAENASWREHKGAVLVDRWRFEVAEEVERERTRGLRPVSQSETVAQAVAEVSDLLLGSPFVRSFKVASLVFPHPASPLRSAVPSAEIWLASATPTKELSQALIQTAFLVNAQRGNLAPGLPTTTLPEHARDSSPSPGREGPSSVPPERDPSPSAVPLGPVKLLPPPRKASLPFSNLLPGSPLPLMSGDVPAKAAALLGLDCPQRDASTTGADTAFATSEASNICQPSQAAPFQSRRPGRSRANSSASSSVASSAISSLFSNSAIGNFVRSATGAAAAAGGGRPSFSSFSTPSNGNSQPSTSFEAKRRLPFAKRKTPPAPLDLPRVSRTRRSKSGPEPLVGAHIQTNDDDEEVEEVESLMDVLDPAMSGWNWRRRQPQWTMAAGPEIGAINMLVRKLSQGKLTRSSSGRRKHKRAMTTRD
ncbi:hypothetical protein JCM10908_000243 [Rhodotorula pacifica]|uniref:uncharacterized protein n=1 Tax=Rhodotorula pacifica TaxID=1495444 RepID=UPI003179535F